MPCVSFKLGQDASLRPCLRVSVASCILASLILFHKIIVAILRRGLECSLNSMTGWPADFAMEMAEYG